MKNSKWIDEFMDEIDLRKVILLYGNIYDCYYYDNQLLELDAFMKENKALNIADDFYTIENMKEISKNLESGDESQAGYNAHDALLNVNQLDQILETEVSANQKTVIYIKNSTLFFSDYNCDTTTETSHSIHYFNELMKKLENRNVIIVMLSEKLQYFPPAIYNDNPNVVVIQIEYPELEVREEFIKNYLIEEDVSQNYYEILNDFAKMTSGRTLKEIEKVFIKGENKSLNYDQPQEFISYYDFGKEESPWTKLRPEEVINIDQTLAQRVLGQDDAIKFIKKILVRAKLDLATVHQSSHSNRPIGLFFFVGPTGVGKTELAKALTDAVFKSESEFKRFDMSEYNEEVALNKLIGSSPGYIGYEEGGQLTNWVKEHPFSVILFDEIEKADKKIWDTFLQILEDGRLTDNKGKTVYFKETIIIFTSNVGNKKVNKYLESRGEEAKEDKIKRMYLEAVRNYFKNELNRVEILNRIGNNIIPFNHIDNEEIYRKITELKLATIVDNIKKKLDCKLEYSEEVIDFIIAKIKESGEKFGGRAVVNFLETYLVNEFGLFYIEAKPYYCKAYVNQKGERIDFKQL